ncbi:MAG: toxic anion resistance protein [Chromatiaceae bacterium]|nr:toxic anion resistance protein [Chromatiaceae bacterium]
MSNNNQTLVFAEEQQLRKELDVADPEAIHADAQADPELAQQADDLVARILSTPATDADAQHRTKAAIEAMGSQLQKDAAHRSQMLKQPVAKLYERSEDGGEVANALVDLKIKVEELDPGKYDLEAGWLTRLLGRIPGVGTPLKRYFSRYESASTVIDAIIRSLKDGQEQLKRDNITLIDDQKLMRELTHKLERAVKLGQLIDAGLEDKLQTEISESDARYKFIQEELLFPLRQRIQDLQQQLLVNQQGFLTIEMIIRNNKELIRGVNRALNVTVSALQVAVTLALALANQRIVLEKVQALTDTTSDLITGTAERLKTQGAAIHKQASATQIDIDALKRAFEDVRAALDDVSRYRQEALPKMAERILQMDKMAAESDEAIARVEHAERVAKDFPIEIID